MLNAAFSGQVLKIICYKQINWVNSKFHETNLYVYSHNAWNIWDKCTCVIFVCQVPPSNRRFYDFGMEFIDRITTDPATIYVYTHILLVSASHLSSDRRLPSDKHVKCCCTCKTLHRDSCGRSDTFDHQTATEFFYFR